MIKLYWPEVLAILACCFAYVTLHFTWIKVLPPDNWPLNMATVLLDVKTSFTFFDMVHGMYLPWLLLLLAILSVWRLKWTLLLIPPVIGFVYYALKQTEQQLGGQERWQAKGFETAIDNGLWLFLAAVFLLGLLSLLRWFQPKKF